MTQTKSSENLFTIKEQLKELEKKTSDEKTRADLVYLANQLNMTGVKILEEIREGGKKGLIHWSLEDKLLKKIIL